MNKNTTNRSFAFMLASMLMGDLSGRSESLIAIAFQAQRFRRFDLLEKILERVACVELPARLFDCSEYLSAFLAAQRGGTSLDQAIKSFTRLAGNSTIRSRALYSLGTYALRFKDFPAAMEFYHEAIVLVGENLQPKLSIMHMQAVAQSDKGNHKGALAALELILPVAQSLDSLTRVTAMNSYSIELAHNRRYGEAKAIASMLANSEAAKSFPELKGTLAEVEELQMKPSPRGKVIKFPLDRFERRERYRECDAISSVLFSDAHTQVPLPRLRLARRLISAPYITDETVRISEVLVEQDKHEYQNRKVKKRPKK